MLIFLDSAMELALSFGKLPNEKLLNLKNVKRASVLAGLVALLVSRGIMIYNFSL